MKKPTKNAEELRIVKRILELVDYGLTGGLGRQAPGKMCVEAVVCAAYGLPHGDEPPCVHPIVRSMKIELNDKNWGSKANRSKGLRRVAVAQIGTNSSKWNKSIFSNEMRLGIVKQLLPKTLKLDKGEMAIFNKFTLDKPAGVIHILQKHKSLLGDFGYFGVTSGFDINECVYTALRDIPHEHRIKHLATMAEIMVQALIKSGAPGCKYLYLAGPPPKF